MHFLSSRKRTNEQELEAGAKRLRAEGGRGLGWRRAEQATAQRTRKQDFAKETPRQASRLLSRDKKESEEANGNADGTAPPPRQATALQAEGNKRRSGRTIRTRRSKPRRYWWRWGAVAGPPQQAAALLVAERGKKRLWG